MKRTAKQRFESKINKTQSCWLWVGSINSRGYGQFWENKKSYQAHRYSWSIYVGEIPNGLYICHKCDVKECVNPAHLFAGTPSQNMQDCIQKKRFSCPSIKGFCKKGHPYIGENILVTKKQTLCRTCQNMRARKSYWKAKEAIKQAIC